MTKDEAFGFLVRVMYDTRQNKRYGGDSVAFEWHWSSRLVRMLDALLTRTFGIDWNYAFLTSYPKWREIFATIFQGRMADHLLCDTLSPYIEQELHDRTFNNRKGKGAQAAMNQVIEDICEVSNDYTEPCRIIKWDLKGFFPNALCSEMQRFFEKVIDKYSAQIITDYDEDELPAFLKWLAMKCVNSNPSAHCELRTPRRLWDLHIKPEKSLLMMRDPSKGAPIGRMSSQNVMGLYLNDEVKWLNDECSIRSTLFMDDCVEVVPEHLHQYALSLFPELRRRLAIKGVILNEKKFYDQPYKHGLEFLGSHIHPWSIILNDKTWARCLERITEYNRIPSLEKYDYLDHFVATINSYTGLLKNRTSYNRIMMLKDTIADDWWLWLDWDQRRLCVISKPQYSFRARLNSKYHLKLKRI
jgi:hypothetical protein